MKSKISGIFLLICLGLPLLVTHTWLQHQKVTIRRQVKRRIIAGLHRDELVLLTFTKKEAQTLLRWEHAHEFEYRGQMYDIVESDVESDTLKYWCWSDDEETQLNQQLSKLLAIALGHSPQNKEKQKQLIQFYKSLYFLKASDWRIPSIPTEQTFCLYYLTYSSISLNPPKPPPRLA
uniref:Uncharacterized protein n=1 Tax=Roseihalotalea indica TaxID=2867963 RepID=A0AA49GQ46_9BACT|nr:hypothetical protein K4G66_06825 [Tunicatimonas sp. TK19036]